ncbi:MAG TPA: hypothetical protein VF708_19535 [Pyrinomonadaceae bacterium]
MRTAVKASRCATIFCLVLFAVAPSLSAQGGGKLTRRIQFQRGQSTARLKGQIRKNEEIVYLLRANEGQTLSVRVTASTPNHDVVFTLKGPNDTPLMPEGDMDTEWSGQLPATGDYQISLGMIESKFSQYTLEVSVR